MTISIVTDTVYIRALWRAGSCVRQTPTAQGACAADLRNL